MLTATVHAEVLSAPREPLQVPATPSRRPRGTVSAASLGLSSASVSAPLAAAPLSSLSPSAASSRALPFALFKSDDQMSQAPRMAGADAEQRMLDVMHLIRTTVQPTHRVVRAGDVIYHAGQPMTSLFLINAGAFKLVSRSLDGREQIVSLKFRGDWLGFSGIAQGRHACDAIAMDTGNVSIIPFEALASACGRFPDMLSAVLIAMSTEIAQERESLMSVCTLASLARVAEFLCSWARSMAERGLRADELTLRMTRADLGNYLGMTLETVSRCLSRLAKDNLIQFGERGRRHISIPDLQSLEQFVIAGSADRVTALQ